MKAPKTDPNKFSLPGELKVIAENQVWTILIEFILFYFILFYFSFFN